MTEAAAAAAAADPPLVILVVVMVVTRVVSRISFYIVFKKWSVQERKKEKEEIESRTK